MSVPRLPSHPRAPRSSSSSALFMHSRPTTHIRRPSRLPHSVSSNHLPSPQPPHQQPPTPSSMPPARPRTCRHTVHRVVATVDYFIALLTARQPKRKHLDHTVAFSLLAVFILLFLVLFVVINSLYGSNVDAYQQQVDRNLRLVAANLPPKQFWPLPDSASHALNNPQPVRMHASVDDIHARQRETGVKFWAKPAAVPELTLVAACRDRTAYLQTALPTWQNALSAAHSIVLVDWGSTPPDSVPLAEVVRAARDPRISVVTLASDAPWMLSKAYNLAFALIDAAWVLKVDCDTMLKPDFLSAHPLPSPHKYYRFQWHRAASENEQHLNGVFLAPTEALRKVHGYDERITTYGWDDDDLYSRLEADGVNAAIGLAPINMHASKLSHIHHSDALRSTNHAAPLLQTQINQHASSKVISWTHVGAAQKTVFQLDILSKDARFLRATIVQTPPPLLQLLSEVDKSRITEQATNTILHDIYAFPWSVLSEINRSRQQLLQTLTDLEASSKWNAKQGVVFAEIGGTIPQRLMGVISALALAISFDKPLFLAWNGGGRHDVAPRITDFFDVDASNRALSNSAAAYMFQVAAWKCRSTLATCEQGDESFKRMAEFRTGTEQTGSDEAAREVERVLKGQVDGKQHVLLRLEGSFPLQTFHDRECAARIIRVSRSLEEVLKSLPPLNDYLGVYVGRGVTKRGAEAMAERLKRISTSASFFVTGANREVTDYSRALLQGSGINATIDNMNIEVAECMRDIAHLFALARCKAIVNDGRAPRAVLELIQLLKYRDAQVL